MTITRAELYRLAEDHRKVGISNMESVPGQRLQELFDAGVASWNKASLPPSEPKRAVVYGYRKLWILNAALVDDGGSPFDVHVHYNCPGTRVFDAREKTGIWPWLRFKESGRQPGKIRLQDL